MGRLPTKLQEDNRIVERMKEAFSELLEDADKPVSVEDAVIHAAPADFGETYVNRVLDLLPRIRKGIEQDREWKLIPITAYYFDNFSDSNDAPDLESDVRRCVAGAYGAMRNVSSSPLPVGLCRATEGCIFAEVHRQHRVASSIGSVDSAIAVSEAMGQPTKLDGKQLVGNLLGYNANKDGPQ
jgi:hypothetical protein